MSIDITVEHDGTSYRGEVMRIKSTTLGYEDHGILSAYLSCEGNGSGILVGGYALDTYSPTEKRRVGDAFGTDHLIAILRTVGVESWEKLVGKDVIVLFDGARYSGSCVGIASLDGSRVLDLGKHAEAWRASQLVSA